MKLCRIIFEDMLLLITLRAIVSAFFEALLFRYLFHMSLLVSFIVESERV